MLNLNLSTPEPQNTAKHSSTLSTLKRSQPLSLTQSAINRNRFSLTRPTVSQKQNKENPESISSAFSGSMSQSKAAPKDNSTFLAELAHHHLDRLINRDAAETSDVIEFRLESLELFFSTKRDRKYHAELEEQSKPKLMYFARQDRYAEFVVRITQALQNQLQELNNSSTTLVKTTAEQVQAVFEEMLNAICDSYKENIKNRLKKGESIEDDRPQTLIFVLRQHLWVQATDAHLIHTLTDKTSLEMETLYNEAEEISLEVRFAATEAQEALATYNADAQRAFSLTSKHSAVKSKKDDLNLEELALQSMAINTQDAQGRTLLDKAIEYGNVFIIEDILACAKHVDVPVEEILRDALLVLLNTNRQHWVLRLAAADGYLFNSTLVAKIRQKPAGMFPETPSSNERAPFSEFFDEKNNFILAPKLIEQIEADTFIGLLRNIYAKSYYIPHIENLLNRAVQLGHTIAITDILNYAKNFRIDLIELLSSAIKKITRENDERGLLHLAVHGCLFDPAVVNKIQTHSNNHFSALFDDNNNLILTSTRLSYADDDTLVSLIDFVNETQWSSLHAEITRRYVDSNPFNVPELMWRTLHKMQQSSERFEKLANYFDEAFIHVITQYKKAVKKHKENAQKHYKQRLEVLLNVIQKYSSTDEHSLQQQAFAIADVLSQDTSSVAVPLEGTIAPRKAIKTQQIFLDKKKILEQNREVPELQLSHIEKPTREGLKNLLDKTAGSIAEQQAQQKRAIVAYAVFRSTLEYLRTGGESTPNKNPFTCCLPSSMNAASFTTWHQILNDSIQFYIKGDLSAAALTQELKSYYTTSDNKTSSCGNEDDETQPLQTTPKSSLLSGNATMFKGRASQLLADAVENSEELLKIYSV